MTEPQRDESRMAFVQKESQRMNDELIRKGFTPRMQETHTADGAGDHSSWWENNAQHISWSEATVLVALLAFILLLIQGRPLL